MIALLNSLKITGFGKKCNIPGSRMVGTMLEFARVRLRISVNSKSANGEIKGNR